MVWIVLRLVLVTNDVRYPGCNELFLRVDLCCFDENNHFLMEIEAGSTEKFLVIRFSVDENDATGSPFVSASASHCPSGCPHMIGPWAHRPRLLAGCIWGVAHSSGSCIWCVVQHYGMVEECDFLSKGLLNNV